MIAVDLWLQKQYWVLTTICIIFLRLSISTIFSFTSMRIIGTIIGEAIASVITAYVYYPGLLLSFLFPFATMHLAMSRVNEILATILLSTFLLVLLNIMSHGQMLLAQTRILDTIVRCWTCLGRGISALERLSVEKALIIFAIVSSANNQTLFKSFFLIILEPILLFFIDCFCPLANSIIVMKGGPSIPPERNTMSLIVVILRVFYVYLP